MLQALHREAVLGTKTIPFQGHKSTYVNTTEFGISGVIFFELHDLNCKIPAMNKIILVLRGS